MSPNHRQRVHSTLSAIQLATKQAADSQDDMAAYVYRLAKHIQDGAGNALFPINNDTAVADPGGLAPEWCVASTSQIIHEQLYAPMPAPVYINSVEVPPIQEPTLEALFPAPDDDIWYVRGLAELTQQAFVDSG